MQARNVEGGEDAGYVHMIVCGVRCVGRGVARGGEDVGGREGVVEELAGRGRGGGGLLASEGSDGPENSIVMTCTPFPAVRDRRRADLLSVRPAGGNNAIRWPTRSREMLRSLLTPQQQPR